MKKLILLAAILAAPVGNCAPSSAPTLQDYMAIYHGRMNSQIERNRTVVILGDSISQAWLTDNYEKGTTANFAVGGSTSQDVLEKIARTSVCKAGNVQLMVGINDIYHGLYSDLANNTRTIAQKINCAKVTWLGVMHPTASKFDADMHQEIDFINTRIKLACQSMRRCTYVEPVTLFDDDYLPDGLHPSANGYAKMNANILNSKLSTNRY